MDKYRWDLIDYLKGISITGVVLFHLISLYLDVPSILKTASYFGGAGVHIFIICSGFGLSLSNHIKPVGWSHFMRKRFLKIYIPYTIIIFISFLTPYMYTNDNRVFALLSHILLFKMFIPKYEDSFGGQFWYISTIFQFYIVFNLLIFLKKRFGVKIFLLFACSCSLAWAIFISITGLYRERIWNSFFLQYLWEFALGIFIADLYIERGKEYFHRIRIWQVLCVTIVSIIVFITMALKGGALKNFNDLFSVLSFGGICYILYNFISFKKIFCWISKFSYELYLTHIITFTSCFHFLSNKLPNLLVGLLALLVSYLIAYVYGLFYQKCFHKGILKRSKMI